MIQIAMNEPDNLVLVMQYFDRNVNRLTLRTISPTKWDGHRKFYATCLSKQDVRSFILSNVRNLQFKHASQVAMPEPFKVAKQQRKP